LENRILMEKLNKNLFKFIKFLGHYFVAKRGPSGPIELVYWRVPNLALRFCVLSMITGVHAIENIQILLSSFGGAIFSCFIFYLSLCLYNKFYNKLETNDNTNKKDALFSTSSCQKSIFTQYKKTTKIFLSLLESP